MAVDAYRIAQLLRETYVPSNVDFSIHKSRKEYLSDSIIPSDIFVFSGQGATLQTSVGELIDLASMTFNCILGQNDPWVNANLIAYILSDRPSFLTTRLGSEFYYKVACRIIKIIGMKDAVINHRQCNGTDVTELAILAAYRHKKEGQSILVSFENSYHGQNLTAYHISGSQTKHRFLIPDSPVRFLEQPTNTNNIDGSDSLSEQDAQSLQTLEEVGENVFAVIIEPIQVNNAVNTPTKIFMQKLKEVCVKKEISLVFDEVQTGFGWLGKMSAAERYGVQPNLLALSKALTAGSGALSALVSDKLYKDIPEGTGAKTNGADIRSLVSCNAVIDRLIGLPKDSIPQGIPDDLANELESGLLAQFDKKKTLLQRYLQEIQVISRGLIKSLKGDGLIRGVEIVDAKGRYDAKKTEEIQADLLSAGVLVRHSKHTLIFKPPLVITQSEMNKGFEKVKKVIRKHI